MKTIDKGVREREKYAHKKVRPPRKTEEGAQKTMFKRERYKHEGEGIDPSQTEDPKRKLNE